MTDDKTEKLREISDAVEHLVRIRKSARPDLPDADREAAYARYSEAVRALHEDHKPD